MPCVSVVIPAYNAANFITDAYRSVVDQTIDDWEVIFVNDGSQDGTLAIVRSLAATDSRIKVVDLALNSGPACARNAALAIAEGDWIAMLDADDWYSCDRLEVLTRAAERTTADIVLDNQFVVDPVSRCVGFAAFEPTTDDVRILEFADFLRNTQSNTLVDFGYLKPIIRRRWLVANDMKYHEKLRLGEDLMLLFECYARSAKVVLASKPYYHYSSQYSQVSRTKSPTTRTEASYEPLVADMERFLETHRSRRSLLENCLVASACEALRETMTVAALKTCLKRQDIVGFIGCLRHPIRLSRGVYFEKRRSILLRYRAKKFCGSKGNMIAGDGD
jgi:succinoglycan biosynthesis protein ExoO